MPRLTRDIQQLLRLVDNWVSSQLAQKRSLGQTSHLVSSRAGDTLLKPTLVARIDRLSELGQTGALARGLKGLEKESLRVTGTGNLARTEHPKALGSALTHRLITTDYSEALVELVTPPAPTARETVDCLSDIHQWVYSKLEDELLWPVSMPCRVTSDADVPVAWYGTSNVGQMKRIYRIGLGHRYGRLMQTISGVHYNYSLPDEFWPVLQQAVGNQDSLDEFISARYLGLVRNFRRVGWLVLYLYGASPALCQSFLGNREHRLDSFGNGTLYLPYATSMRMSDLGYSNNVQSRLNISANSLEEYTDGLERAITTPWPDYERIGVVVDGEYRQLNANLLQIENEYYSLMRPKRAARSGQSPTQALRRGGIEYVEMRALDVNPFAPAGVSLEQMHFLEALLMLCALHDSPPLHDRDEQEHTANKLAVAREGRTPGLRLQRAGAAVPLRDWALRLIDEMEPLCRLLDAAGGDEYSSALARQRESVLDPERTLSAQVLAGMSAHEHSFFDYALAQANAVRRTYRAPAENARKGLLDEEAASSLARQEGIEQADAVSFDEYLQQYYAQTSTRD